MSPTCTITNLKQQDTMKTYIVRISLAVALSLICVIGYSQSKAQFDEIKFLESQHANKMVYIKWYSTGKNAAPMFHALRYDNQEPIEVKAAKAAYIYHDTAFYVMQDTMPPLVKDTEMLQYFIVPYDTAGNAGTSSPIAIITKPGNRWFTGTLARKSTEVKGIELEWSFSDASVISHYDLFRSTKFAEGYEPLASLPPGDKSYTDLSIKPDLVYYYKLNAIPLDGNKPITSNIFFSAGFDPNPPVSPYILSARGVKNGAMLTIEVTDKEATGIRLYRDDGHTMDLKVASDLIKLSNSTIITCYDTLSKLSGRVNYTYAAKTENTSFVESPFSNTVSVRPLISIPPSNPAALTAYEDNGKVKLFWQNMEEIDPAVAGYIIQRRQLQDGKGQAVNADFIVETTLNNIIDSTAMPGKTYTYHVSTIDIDRNISKHAATATVAMKAYLPVEPVELTGYKTDGGIFLTWGQAVYDDIASVKIYRRQGENKAQLLSTLAPDTTEYFDTDIVKDAVYIYHLATVNKAGQESKPSEEVVVE